MKSQIFIAQTKKYQETDPHFMAIRIILKIIVSPHCLKEGK